MPDFRNASPAEKRAAIRNLLDRYEAEECPSDRAIADYLGVSNHLVYAVRTGHRRGSDDAVRDVRAEGDPPDPAAGGGWQLLAWIGGGALVFIGGIAWATRQAARGTGGL